MKYIITDFFEKQFVKVVKDISIFELVSKVRINSKTFINLKEPFVKIKFNTRFKSYRLIIAFEKENLIILFINIFDKKDKKYWENINWELHKNDIMEWKLKNEECIKSWDYYKI